MDGAGHCWQDETVIHSDGFKMEQPIREAWRNAVSFDIIKSGRASWFCRKEHPYGCCPEPRNWDQLSCFSTFKAPLAYIELSLISRDCPCYKHILEEWLAWEVRVGSLPPGQGIQGHCLISRLLLRFGQKRLFLVTWLPVGEITGSQRLCGLINW